MASSPAQGCRGAAGTLILSPWCALILPDRPELEGVIHRCADLVQRLPDAPKVERRAGNENAPGAGNVSGTNDPTSVLKAAWATILEQDYAPVFEPALAVVNALPEGKAIAYGVRRLAECANDVADSLSDLGYDHAGPLYHAILGSSAKSDGAFYTNNVSALMLARLALDDDFVDWSDDDAVGNLRIIDPACGTGTLLMAALKTIKDRMAEHGERSKDDAELMHRTFVEDVLCGLDINRHGVQLAACNLTLGAPTVDYSRMNLHTMKHGRQEDGTVRAGSLEILTTADDEHDLSALSAPLRGLTELESQHVTGKGEATFELHDVDMVIMNAPFTANDKRSKKYSEAARKAMQTRELDIQATVERRDAAAQGVITANSIRSFFTPLAEKLLNEERGTLAQVIPTTACTGASGIGERRFLAQRFHIERVVTTHDPRHINFSENTSIHESLLVCRRRTDDTEQPTEFFSLSRMPHTPDEAREAIDAIRSSATEGTGETAWGTRTLWPKKLVETGDWSPSQWMDSGLAQTIRQFESNDELEPLQVRYAMGPLGRVAQDSWKKCDAKEAEIDERAIRIFDTISAKVRRCMSGEAEQWGDSGRTARTPLAKRSEASIQAACMHQIRHHRRTSHCRL